MGRNAIIRPGRSQTEERDTEGHHDQAHKLHAFNRFKAAYAAPAPDRALASGDDEAPAGSVLREATTGKGIRHNTFELPNQPIVVS